MLQKLPIGAVFLPVQHTPLAVTRPLAVRRDFFQLFHWLPDRAGNPSAWTLGWWLGEVVGDMWIGWAGEENLLVVRGATPPPLPDATGLVTLRLNATGEAEYTHSVRTLGSHRTASMAGETVTWTRLALIAAVLTVTVRGTSAQTGTADGVVALARGDYQRAAEILKPIAEDLRTNDTAAQFFMAGLYESGRGVAADALRACALYQRAAGNSDHPFSREALFLYARLIARGAAFISECQQLANIGFDDGFQPVTFVLGPAHSIEWTSPPPPLRTRGEHGDTKYPSRARTRFLSLQHTELATGPARSLARHFIEFFVWWPSRTAVGGHCIGTSSKSSVIKSSPSTRFHRWPPSRQTPRLRATHSTYASTPNFASTTTGMPDGPCSRDRMPRRTD